ncbi:hypothetical protein V1498_13405 [Peribacillus sp. SCS-26]|uniref:hypothetical protein n=1 Tax=Paraperibacillus marinus TaxID=3115295 RepID=UPI0039063554
MTDNRPVSYQQTLGTKTQRARELPEGYDLSAFDEDNAENPTRREEKERQQ